MVRRPRLAHKKSSIYTSTNAEPRRTNAESKALSGSSGREMLHIILWSRSTLMPSFGSGGLFL